MRVAGNLNTGSNNGNGVGNRYLTADSFDSRAILASAPLHVCMSALS